MPFALKPDRFFSGKGWKGPGVDDESGPMGSLGGSTCCSSALLVIPAPSARVQTFFPRRDGLAERFFDVTSGNGTVA